MPIYEYRCSRCGHELETLQKITETPLSVCPACGEEKLVKKISAAGFQLKGTGWYATDFKSSGAKPTTKPAAEPATATDTAKADKADAPVTEAAKSSDAKPESSKSASDTPSESKRDAKPASSTPGGSAAGPAGQ